MATRMGGNETLEKFIIPILPTRLAEIIGSAAVFWGAALTEIRLRVRQPLLLVAAGSDRMLTAAGHFTESAAHAYYCSQEDVTEVVRQISQSSWYAFEQELKMGYITIGGGCRVGLAGQVLLEDGVMRSFKYIGALNIRLAREVLGCAAPLLPYLTDGTRILNTLLIGPPACGKTTLLRDIIRQLSWGWPGCPGQQLGVVDERSELAACCFGVPTLDVGGRTDVLDACPKAYGLLLLIRALAPAAVATDEIGRAEDAAAVREALHAGVSIITTIHGRSLAEVRRRPQIGALVQEECFSRYVLLGEQGAPGSIRQVLDGSGNMLWQGG